MFSVFAGNARASCLVVGVVASCSIHAGLQHWNSGHRYCYASVERSMSGRRLNVADGDQCPSQVGCRQLDIPLGSSRHVSTRHFRYVEHLHFDCVELVKQHGSTRSTRRARHVERVVSRRDVTSQVKFGLMSVSDPLATVVPVYLQLVYRSSGCWCWWSVCGWWAWSDSIKRSTMLSWHLLPWSSSSPQCCCWRPLSASSEAPKTSCCFCVWWLQTTIYVPISPPSRRQRLRPHPVPWKAEGGGPQPPGTSISISPTLKNHNSVNVQFNAFFIFSLPLGLRRHVRLCPSRENTLRRRTCGLKMSKKICYRWSLLAAYRFPTYSSRVTVFTPRVL